MGIVSYAQNLEDVMLWRALDDVGAGYYIDIGAQHPVVDSISKAFYERGWRGIHIEPATEYAQMLRSDRPDETVIQAAILDSPGIVRFYEIPGGGLSTACREIALGHQQKLGCTMVEQLVTAVTLDGILDLASSDVIHWLKIDVEGSEREVLSGWRNSPRRPWVVIIEATYPLTPRDTHQNWEDMILAKDYELVYRDGLNRYYLHHAQSARKARFTLPPNVFDGFQLSGKATSMTTNLVSHYEHAIAQITQERNQSQNDLALHQAECRRLEIQVKKQKGELELFASNSLAQQQAAANEQLKILAARERDHSEKIGGLYDAWRHAEAEQARQAESAKVNALDEMRSRYEAEHNNLQAQIADAGKALQTAQDCVLDLQAKVDLERDQRAKLLSDAQEKIKVHQQEIHKLCEKRDFEEVQYQQTLSELHDSLRQIKMSLSWRMTSPFRFVAEILNWERLRGRRHFRSTAVISDSASLTRQTDRLMHGIKGQVGCDMFRNEQNKLPAGKPPPVSLDDLLARNDRDFIGCAYLIALGRYPDPEGLGYYLGRVRSGVSKLEILAQLRKSPEGQAHVVSLRGLDVAVNRYQRSKLPLVGWAFRWIYGLEADDPGERRLRRLENQLSVIADASESTAAQLGKLLAEGSRLIDRQSQAQSSAMTQPRNAFSDEVGASETQSGRDAKHSRDGWVANEVLQTQIQRNYGEAHPELESGSRLHRRLRDYVRVWVS